MIDMDPSSGENARFEAPLTPETSEQAAERNIEALPARPEKSPAPQPDPPVAGLPADIPAAAAVQIPDDSQTPSTSSPWTDSDEKDRIDKQWVDKAKAVIASTKDDPFSQKKEITKVKAEYIKTRFNKILKTDPGVS